MKSYFSPSPWVRKPGLVHRFFYTGFDVTRVNDVVVQHQAHAMFRGDQAGNIVALHPVALELLKVPIRGQRVRKLGGLDDRTLNGKPEIKSTIKLEARLHVSLSVASH
jgi:hypothetical protein